MKAKNEKIQEAITSLLADKYYFFGEFSLFLNYEEATFIPTAGVTIDPKVKRFKYVYNPEFVEALSKPELRFLQMHEILHIVSNHLRRVELNEYDPMLSNIAQDMLINKFIMDVVKDDDTVKMIEGGLLLPDEYKGELIFDEVYKWLEKEQKDLKKDEKKEQKKSEGNSNSKNNQGQGQQESEGSGVQGNDESPRTQNNPQPSEGGGPGEPTEQGSNGQSQQGNSNTPSKSDIQNGLDKKANKPKNDPAKKNLEKMKESLVKENYKFDEHMTINDEISDLDRHNLVDEIVTTLKHKGSVPGNIANILDKLDVRKPKDNIFRKIKQSIERSSIGTDKFKTFLKQNRRAPGVLKGNQKTKIKFNVVLDTSGSMGGEFNKVLSYLLHSQSEFTMIQIDTEIQEIKQVKSAKDLMVKGFKVKGLGGTRLQPAVDKLRELGKLKEACIVLTDGWTDNLDFKGFDDVIIVTTDCEVGIVNKPKRISTFKVKQK